MSDPHFRDKGILCADSCVDGCFYCSAPLSPRHEHDHWPIAKRNGGNLTVPICINCHDLKDRVPIDRWPAELWVKAFADAGPLGRLLIAKASGMLAESQRVA